VITKNAVRHGHFGGQRLERVEALVGVVNRALELLILLLKSFLVVAESVVVADLPKHPGVRPDRGNHRNRSNEGQHGKAVQHIRRDNKLLQLAGRCRNIKRIVLARHHKHGPSGL